MIMEGILFEIPVSVAAAIVGGTIVLGAALVVAILGRMAEEEAEGRRFFWAEWPLPEAEKEEPAVEEDLRRAA
ncbi:MAG: hypothetical protein ACXWXD_10220 [Candidatus Deferrimicrobiaceae bacterium]